MKQLVKWINTQILLHSRGYLCVGVIYPTSTVQQRCLTHSGVYLSLYFLSNCLCKLIAVQYSGFISWSIVCAILGQFELKKLPNLFIFRSFYTIKIMIANFLIFLNKLFHCPRKNITEIRKIILFSKGDNSVMTLDLFHTQ
jgi:hypothetical protein